MKNGILGKLYVKLIPSILAISINASIGIILIITIDRCRSICQPLKTPFSKRIVHAAVCITIVISLCVEIPYSVYLTEVPKAEVTLKCQGKNTVDSTSLQNRSALNNNISMENYILDKTFIGYVSCDTDIKIMLQLLDYYKNININISTLPINLCQSHCKQLLPICATNMDKIYYYS